MYVLAAKLGALVGFLVGVWVGWRMCESELLPGVEHRFRVTHGIPDGQPI